MIQFYQIVKLKKLLKVSLKNNLNNQYGGNMIYEKLFYWKI